MVYDRSWIILRTWLQLLAHILHIIWDLESWFNRKNLHHRGERWGSISPCVDTTMKSQAMLITSLGFCFKRNPECQVSKCKSSLVYSSHNAYYRKWNRLTYILRHEHMYTTFHRNYVYSPFSSEENHTFVSPQKSLSLFQKTILVSDCHRMHAKKLPKLERWYTPKTICIVVQFNLVSKKWRSHAGVSILNSKRAIRFQFCVQHEALGKYVYIDCLWNTLKHAFSLFVWFVVNQN